MKLIINPTKTLYIENNKDLRLGNFPITGKSIECVDEKISKFFKSLDKPTNVDEVVASFSEICNENIETSKVMVQYLIDENILINYDKYINMTKNQKYNRELLYFYMLSNKDMTSDIQNVSNKNILILGVGGIGSIVADYLVRAGFTNLTLLDYDYVDESNLIRQTTYFYQDIGKSKVECLKKYLKRINPSINIKTSLTEVKEDKDIENLVKISDFVFCSLDKPVRIIRRLVNRVCVKYNKPVLFSGFAEHVGMVGPFVVPHKTACLNCINMLNEADVPLDNVKKIPSFGPLCGIIATCASNEIINYFLKFKRKSLQNKTLMIDLINYNTTIKVWHLHKNCDICGGKYDS